MQMHVNRTPSSFFCHDLGDYWCRGGVSGGAVSGAGSPSTQGSKISKPEGCVEDGEGGCSGRVLVAVVAAFVPAPLHQGLAEKITEQPDSSWLPARPPRLAGTGQQMLELQQGVQMIPARTPHAAPRPHNASG